MDMKTYPYNTPEDIIELVEKREYDGMELLAHELATLRAEDLATINDLFKSLCEAEELIREIRDNEVNPQDEAGKFLRDHQPSELSKARQELQDAVKRMEAVSQTELQRVWANGHRTRLAPCIDAVRARLISAAKGES